MKSADAQRLVPGELVGRHELPVVSMTQLAFYCAAVGVTDPIHYDRQAASEAGFQGVPVNGSLRIAWVTSALEELVGTNGQLEFVRCQHKGAVFVGEREVLEVRFRGHEVIHDGAWRLDCDVVGLVGDKVVDVAEGSILFASDERAG